MPRQHQRAVPTSNPIFKTVLGGIQKGYQKTKTPQTLEERHSGELVPKPKHSHLLAGRISSPSWK